MEKCIIAAVADNGAIGKDNDLLWHIAEDMKYFRQKTTGSPVVMGYMTFLSIGGKPLPKRDNVVISIFPWPDRPDGIKVAGSLEEAYELIAADHPENLRICSDLCAQKEDQQEDARRGNSFGHLHCPRRDAGKSKKIADSY